MLIQPVLVVGPFYPRLCFPFSNSPRVYIAIDQLKLIELIEC